MKRKNTLISFSDWGTEGKMFDLLIGGLDMSVKGLPKWMAKMDPDHLSADEKKTIVRLGMNRMARCRFT